jgi:diguanylate cyclase (GGDEF)-like protein
MLNIQTLTPLFDLTLNKLQAGTILLDAQMRVCFWNNWLTEHSGITQEQIIGKPFFEFLDIQPQSYLGRSIRSSIDQGLSSILSNTIHRHPLPLFTDLNKEEPLEQKLILSQLKTGQDRYCLIHVYDVSEVIRREKSLRRQAQTLNNTIDELTEAEDQLRSLFELSPEAILLLDQSGRLLRLNAAAEKMFEVFEYSDMYDVKQFLEGVDPEKPLNELFFSGSTAHAVEHLSFTGVSLSGRNFPVKLSVLRSQNHAKTAYTVICTDITEQERTERRLKQLAHYDSLTGLANRATFSDRIRHTLKHSKRQGQSVALIYLDLDNLKPINDHFGHRGGDLLLREVAKRLQASVRESDLVSRIGGDEFTIIISETENRELPDLDLIAQRLLETIRQPITMGEESFQPSASIGVAINSSDDPDEMVRHADMAMYTAKAEGKGRYLVYNPDMATQQGKAPSA